MLVAHNAGSAKKREPSWNWNFNVVGVSLQVRLFTHTASGLRLLAGIRFNPSRKTYRISKNR